MKTAAAIIVLIALHIAAEPVLLIDTIDITNDGIKKELLLSRIDVHTNDTLHPEKLEERLSSVDQISRYEITIDTIGENRVALTLDYSLSPPLEITEMGGSLITMKHGEPLSFPHPVVVVGAAHTNVGRTMQTMELELQGIIQPAAQLSWNVPLKVRSSLTLSAQTGSFFSLLKPRNLERFFTNRIHFQHRISPSLRLGGGVQHGYYQYREIREDSHTRFHEVYPFVSCNLVRGERKKNPQRAFRISGEIGTNILRYYTDTTGEYANMYVNADATLFTPLPSSRRNTLINHISLRSTPLGKRNPFQQYYLGSSSTLRGFSMGYLGQNFQAQNQCIYGVEYRFPLLERKKLTFQRLGRIYSPFQEVPLSIDGGIFLNTGYLWKDFLHPRKAANYDYGVSTGVGLRIFTRKLNLFGSTDIAFPLAASRTGKRTPILHIYMGLPF
ncbi:MAG: BamA/TamA family outer membrane protein [Fibrobacterota bacterium]